MLPWFLRDDGRLARERKGIDDLQHSANWLTGAEWRMHEGDIGVDVVIRVHDHDYELRVSFPALFPDAPAIVRPRNMQTRMSQHQYGGSEGPLCLEWGPDNWHRDVTAVQMIESAYRLLEIENPLGQNRPELPVSAPSRHRLTLGQELRGDLVRWYSSEGLRTFLASQPKKSIGSFKFSLRKIGGNWIVLVHEAMVFGNEIWKDASVPTTLPEAKIGDLKAGAWFKTELESTSLKKFATLTELKSHLGDLDDPKILARDGSSPIEGFGKALVGILVADKSDDLHCFLLLDDGSLIFCSRVISEQAPVNSRTPDATTLNGKSVGIVGLGSAGSKIAVSLARMGIRKFYLVDHDVLLPENLHRHTLDWQNVTRHKVDAIETAIHQIAPDAVVHVSRTHLTGQESNAVISSVLKKLSECDLVVDATANSRVFNLLAAMVRAANKAMVWLEIFGGGIGGLVARSRPSIDPSPHDMRIAYLQYCTENPHSSPKKAAENYAVETEEGNVLVAMDADIGIISYHTARLVVDCLVSPEASNYPNSMYLIGLAKAWVFEAPFATIPIAVASLPESSENAAEGLQEQTDNSVFLAEVFKKI